ncbi:hypothetical protein PF010_g23012 [Phytophthora fragariae]|uniref:DUF2723 domain-containing protein n=1 Tax=Phytophthora fragariae TaxID=53985 RepID=A0A6G0K7G1_9STRA|nr:hypothetical protein PF010_g23012 [Phytophthora fragariae]
MRRRKDPYAAVHAVPPADAASRDAIHKSDSNAPPPTQCNAALSAGDLVVMALLALWTLLGYTMTLYPSVAGGDSGELVAESCHLGVSHPPGYPLFNMAVHIFTRFLPFGETPAWKANFFSAVCDTVAVVFIYLSLLLWMAPTGWTGRRAAAFTAAALFAFSPLIWTYAWTSLRYLQRCELRRQDVTILNLSMMTYNWFATKHTNYPNLQFPGSRLVPFGSVGDGFSMARLLDVNIGHLAPRKRARIFLGGKLSYSDQDFNKKYTLVPFGLLDEFKSLSVPSQPLKPWYSSQQKVRAIIRERLPVLPPEELYNDETWEWTIARDHGMKELNWATYLLERTIAEDRENLSLLSEAAKPMEVSYQFEPPQFWNPAANLKNLGLAYAQMVKSNQEFSVSKDPFLNDVVGKGVTDSTRFKDRASARMLEVWDAWLRVPGAKQDPGYEAIEGVVRKFVPTSVEAQPGDNPRKQSQRRRKKKSAKTKKRGKK